MSQSKVLSAKLSCYYAIPFKMNSAFIPQNSNFTWEKQARNDIYLSQHINNLFAADKVQRFHIKEKLDIPITELFMKNSLGQKELNAYYKSTYSIIDNLLKKERNSSFRVPTINNVWVYQFSTNIGYLILKTDFKYTYNEEQVGSSITFLTINGFQKLLINYAAFCRKLNKRNKPILQTAKTFLPENYVASWNGREIYTFIDANIYCHDNVTPGNYDPVIAELLNDYSSDDSLIPVGDVTIQSKGKPCEQIGLDGGTLYFDYEQNHRILSFKERECALLDLQESDSGLSQRNHDGISNGFLFTYLFAIHERHAILEFISKTVKEEYSTEQHKELLNLQKYYIYDIISDETRYQSFYTALLQYFGNEKLEKEVGEINDRIADQQTKEMEIAYQQFVQVHKEQEEQQERQDSLLNNVLFFLSCLTIVSLWADFYQAVNSIAAWIISILVALIAAGIFFHGKRKIKNSDNPTKKK